MGASQISVTLFHGTQKTTFPVGATPGKNLRWKVFTIDARTAKMYPNVDNEELHRRFFPGVAPTGKVVFWVPWKSVTEICEAPMSPHPQSQ